MATAKKRVFEIIQIGNRRDIASAGFVFSFYGIIDLLTFFPIFCQELIVMIRRRNRTIIPNGTTYIKAGDVVVMYSKLAAVE